MSVIPCTARSLHFGPTLASLLTLALASLAGCFDDSSPGTSNDNGNTNTVGITRTIGVEGGLVALPGARVGIPEGALTEDTEITVTCGGEPPLGYQAFSPVCRFEPAGLTFGAPVTIELLFTGDGDMAVPHWGVQSNGLYGRPPGKIVSPGRMQFLVSSLSQGFVGHRHFGDTATYLASVTNNVDLLFVVDNSGSMADEQALLRDQFSTLMQELRGLTGGLPNIHLGITSTDLGTGNYQISYCEDVGGDQGHLLTGNCTNPTGEPYLVDVEPKDCEIARDANGTCSNNTCAPSNCLHEPNTTFVMDSTTGCPRCRNYAGEDLEDVFSCLASLGTLGCGFEQPLEAMYKALDPATTFNEGFVRDHALLTVVVISDEDDCSAANPQIFDNTQTELNDPLGPLTSFRCFEFGITCNINDRTTQGSRTGCVPREDAGALLYPTSRYIDFLRELKDPDQLIVAAIAGPVDNQTVVVGLDENSQPEVQQSCSTERGGAVPGIRLKTVVEAFSEESDLSWTYSSICSPTFSDALQGIGTRIRDQFDQGFKCLAAPLLGCADVGAEFGVPGDNFACNDNCVATCYVTDVTRLGEPDETWVDLPPCLEVCSDGLCPGNTDRTLAYANAHPTEFDANLPVVACWQVTFDEECADSNNSRIVVSRRSQAPASTWVEVGCLPLPAVETECYDGIDNDGDCQIDELDPDCAATP